MDSIDDIREKEIEMKELQNKLKIIMGELALKILQLNSISIELEQLKSNESEPRAKIFDAARPFN